jgi:Phytanoyl-CoA dioxygenase (PhyH)
MQEFADSSAIANDRDAMRGRLRRDGYLFFRGLIAVETITGLTRQIYATLHAHGWFESLSDVGPGRLAMPPRLGPEGRSPHGDPGYEAVVASTQLQRLAYAPELKRVMRTLIADGAFPLPGWAAPTAARPFPPRATVFRAVYPTSVAPMHNGMYEHQDYRVFGVQDMFTAWIPLIPIAPDEGGLAVRPRGHANGLVRRRLVEASDRWATSEYEPGDVLVFHALTPHAALPNLGQRLRLSLDIRYQSPRVPLLSAFGYGLPGDPRFVEHPVMDCAWWEPIPQTVTVIERELFEPEPPLSASEFVDVPGFQTAPV